MKIRDPQRIIDAAQAMTSAKSKVRLRRRAVVEAVNDVQALDYAARFGEGMGEVGPASQTALRDDLADARRELIRRIHALAKARHELDQRVATWKGLK